MKNLVMSFLGIGAIALGLAPATRAAEPEDIGLDFSFPSSEEETLAAAPAAEVPSSSGVTRLAIPSGGTSIPTGISDASKAMMELPPPPVVSVAPPVVELPPVAEPTPVVEAAAPPAIAPTTEAIGLQFAADPVANLPQAEAPKPIEVVSAGQPADASPAAPDPTAPGLDALFAGNTDSLIARAIGAAEGTRTPDGQKTSAYKGHKDPGNGKWNQGTFSYQHEASSPEDADQRQLTRLRKQADTLLQQAEKHGLELSLEEQLNALDLANQSPRAALSQGGYMDRLKQAREMGLQASEAVLWARTRAFLDPNTQRWNAPGLGNTVERITADQQRRQRAIARAIDAKTLTVSQPTSPPAAASPTASAPAPQDLDEMAGRIIDFNLS